MNKVSFIVLIVAIAFIDTHQLTINTQTNTFLLKKTNELGLGYE